MITALYVPGDRPERFAKAVATGADLVILDLEDAVAPDRKQLARRAVIEWLSTGDRFTPVQVRVDGEEDLAALATVDADFGVRLPKVSAPEQLDAAAARMPGRPLTAIIESALGVERAYALAAHPAVTALAIGEADLVADLGSTHPAVREQVRIRVLTAARAAGLEAPMMSVHPRIDDLDGLRADTEHGRALGFVGRTAIHPTQLPVIREVFAPDPDEVRWATDVLTALDSTGVATLPGGEMVDEAMAKRARRILGHPPSPGGNRSTWDGRAGR